MEAVIVGGRLFHRRVVCERYEFRKKVNRWRGKECAAWLRKEKPVAAIREG